MWIIWAVGYFAMAVAAHGCIARLVWWNDSVSKFLLVGSLLGLMLTGHMSAVYGVALPTFATIAFYAFACELYMFFFTMVMSSVSAKLLMTLRDTVVSDAHIAEMYSADGMVDRRLERLLGIGLLNRDGGQWKLSPKGLRLMRAFVALKRFFDHPIQ